MGQPAKPEPERLEHWLRNLNALGLDAVALGPQFAAGIGEIALGDQFADLPKFVMPRKQMGHLRPQIVDELELRHQALADGAFPGAERFEMRFQLEDVLGFVFRCPGLSPPTSLAGVTLSKVQIALALLDPSI